MEELKGYLLSLITLALLCGILRELVISETARELIRLVCGLCMVLTLLRPFSGLSWEIPQWNPEIHREQAKEYVSDGRLASESAFKELIKAETEAYILDRAGQLEAQITVSIRVNAENIPDQAVLHGDLSQEQKEKLTHLLETDLGLTKEQQIWSGRQN